jgi:AraC-like DNA-binding protein/CheY-like chemotaxis protein
MAHVGRSSWTGHPRILLLYDETATRRFVVDALGAAHAVVETKDAGVALDLLAASAPYFDLVIVTCLSGTDRPRYPRCVELVLTMFQRWPSIPVLVMTRAQDEMRLTADMLVSGVRKFLHKPFAVADLAEVITRLVPRTRPRAPAAPATIATMRRTLTYLGEHFGENPALAALAAMAGMSRSHFSHTFHAVVGMPLRDYIRDLRLRRAHELLLTSTLPITSIAFEAGFYDLPHFDKAFRQRFGTSPQAYRGRNGSVPTAPAGRRGRPPRRGLERLAQTPGYGLPQRS